MKTFWIGLLLATSAITADAPAGFEYWKGAGLQAFEKKLSPKMSAQKIAIQSLGTYGNHSFLVAHREGNGEAELHQTENDVMVVESGEATLVVGGTLVNPRNTAPHEVRAASIQGGEKVPLAAGDIVHVPLKVPHQMLVESGKQITYFVVKIGS